ncbi:MAG: asparagine synthase-related protein [Actinomycetota bacterium]|nr:asparagine synthase-related protein [Actinomycetota bacterium]
MHEENLNFLGDMNEIIKNLKKVLSDTMERSSYKSLLFSGGLDTSILAVIKPKVIGITVNLESEGEDIHYSRSLARFLDIEHFHRKVDVEEAIECIPKVIKILRSFDPAIPNDLVLYFGLELAKNLGLDEIATGDGSDELFGGYSFMKDIDDLENYIQRISKEMSFSSNCFGKFMEIKIIQPFMDRNVMDFALKIPAHLKIRRYNDKVWGKWILRKAFEDVLPENIIWQSKRPLEYGSGMNKLRQVISDKVPDEEFKENSSSVRFINKEHFYYYKIYRKVIGETPKPKDDERSCPGCGTGIKRSSLHCKICGYVLNWRQNHYHLRGDK